MYSFFLIRIFPCFSPSDDTEDIAAATTAPFVRFANGIINETNALVAGTIKVKSIA